MATNRATLIRHQNPPRGNALPQSFVGGVTAGGFGSSQKKKEKGVSPTTETKAKPEVKCPATLATSTLGGDQRIGGLADLEFTRAVTMLARTCLG